MVVVFVLVPATGKFRLQYFTFINLVLVDVTQVLDLHLKEIIYYSNVGPYKQKPVSYRSDEMEICLKHIHPGMLNI